MLTLTLLAAFLLAGCTPRTMPPADANPPLAEDDVLTDESDDAALLPPESPPLGAAMAFDTDFSRHVVPYDEIRSGGPGKDGIPAIDEPRFVSLDEADAWLDPREPVLAIERNGEAHAYPIQILMWHEIVNTVVGGDPVAVTFCPLCNTGIAFERTFDGQVLDFGTTGRLRLSNLVMYDRQTETWWQQGTGQGLAGRYAGRYLTFAPVSMVAWEDFRAAQSGTDARVLSRETGYTRSYGNNPYSGYDDIDSSPFLYDGPETPDVLPPMARVVTVERGDETVAYPFRLLADERVVNDVVAGEPIVVLWEPGAASALDRAAIPQGREVGSVTVFGRAVDGRVLTFGWQGGAIIDEETGSTWNILGQAVAGELEGARLEPVVGNNFFWFSWAAFKPETRVYASQP
jgi:hypothetical protein